MDVNQDDQNKADNGFRISDEWLKTLHSQVGREVSTARQSQQVEKEVDKREMLGT